jgi:polysaccharide export outer membrane protein
MNTYYSVKSKFAVLLLLSTFTLSSCITNRDLEYIRSNKEIKKVKANKQDYRLQAGDLLSVQISTVTEQQHDFFNKEESSSSQLMMQNPYLYGYLIKNDGFLNLPSFGLIKAEGFTLSELENIIQQIAVSYFEQPVVKLNIINFEISILGEVNHPGTFKITDPDVNILYALSLAGDMTQFGNRKKVKVIRNENELNRVFYVDLTTNGVLNNADFMLQSHDIIYIAPLRKKFYAFTNITNVVSMGLSAITLYLLINKD